MSDASFLHPVVRDLAWVMSSPSLLDPHHEKFQLQLPDSQNVISVVVDDGWCQQTYERHLHWLRQLDDHPQELLNLLRQRHNPRLGYYFEVLVEFWLQQIYPDFCFAPHLQIKAEGKTVGEFDFLFSHATGYETSHWEVAVKFYLYYEHEDGCVLWYGPNSRDRLDLKLDKMFLHQLHLGFKPQSQSVLRQMGFLNIVPRALLKGYLFYPASDDWQTAEIDSIGISSQHLRGWWTRLNDFAVPVQDASSRWLYLPRLQWLSSAFIAADDAHKLMNFKTLHDFCLSRLARKQRPPLIAEMQVGDNGCWREVSRGFVLPEQWPKERLKH